MIQNSSDTYVEQIEDALRGYLTKHPAAEITVRRFNSASIRIRIVDQAFYGKGLAEREEEVWPLLERLPRDVQEEITMLLLIAPSEATDWVLNREFEHPSRSLL